MDLPGLAGCNAPHKLAIVGLWELPFFRGRRHTLLAGWQSSGFAIFQSGTPNTVTIFGPLPRGDYNADNTAQQEPSERAGPGT